MTKIYEIKTTIQKKCMFYLRSLLTMTAGLGVDQRRPHRRHPSSLFVFLVVHPRHLLVVGPFPACLLSIVLSLSFLIVVMLCAQISDEEHGLDHLPGFPVVLIIHC
jgi:hypothetical protein